MPQAIVKIETLFKKRTVLYVLIASIFFMFFAWLLYVTLMIAKPSDIAMYFRWDTPPDIYPYRKYLAMLLSTGWISLLIIALLTTVCMPTYLSKKGTINNYTSNLKRSFAPLVIYIPIFKYIILLVTLAWSITGGIVLYETLFRMYPPALIELVQQNYGLETADHWADYIYFLFFMCMFFGSTLVLGPFGIACYFFFKTKGRV